jgi:hypothetical protein
VLLMSPRQNLRQMHFAAAPFVAQHRERHSGEQHPTVVIMVAVVFPIQRRGLWNMVWVSGMAFSYGEVQILGLAT